MAAGWACFELKIALEIALNMNYRTFPPFSKGLPAFLSGEAVVGWMPLGSPTLVFQKDWYDRPTPDKCSSRELEHVAAVLCGTFWTHRKKGVPEINQELACNFCVSAKYNSWASC